MEVSVKNEIYVQTPEILTPRPPCYNYNAIPLCIKKTRYGKERHRNPTHNKIKEDRNIRLKQKKKKDPLHTIIEVEVEETISNKVTLVQIHTDENRNTKNNRTINYLPDVEI